MNFTIKISDDAVADIQNSYDWYENRKLGLGDRFLNDVQAQLNFIKNNPFSFRKQSRYRVAPLKTFPFVIVYAINANIVSVLSVFHTSRSPNFK